MNKTSIGLTGAVAGLLIGVALTMAVSRPQATPPVSSSANGMEMGGTSMQSSMDGMMAALTGKSGDSFDQAFLDEMTTHHQGAVAMAKLALTNAKHPELQQMAKNIISAQTAEIAQMAAWKSQWYGAAQ